MSGGPGEWTVALAVFVTVVRYGSAVYGVG